MQYSDVTYSPKTNENEGFYDKPDRPYMPLALAAVFVAVTLATIKLASFCLAPSVADKQTFTGNSISQVESYQVQAQRSTQNNFMVQTDSEQQKRKLELRKKEDEFYIAATIWGEARGEGYTGMKAVADVILNRENLLKGSIRDIVLSPKQFSCWNKDDPNSKLLTHWHLEHLVGEEEAVWAEAQTIAHEEVEGSMRDITDGATHYHAKTVRPYWTKTVKVVKNHKIRFIKPPMLLAKIGSHIFYR